MTDDGGFFHGGLSNEVVTDDGGFFHGGLSSEVVTDDSGFFQGGLSNEAFEDNFVGDVARLSSSELRDVYRERDELRTQLECATDELRHYKPEYLHAVFSFFFLSSLLKQR